MREQRNDTKTRMVCIWMFVTGRASSVIRINDKDESVIEIDIYNRYVRGSLELLYVPPKVKVLKISSLFWGELTGSVDLTQLPEDMYYLKLKKNQLT